jgi:hypothetical protein
MAARKDLHKNQSPPPGKKLDPEETKDLTPWQKAGLRRMVKITPEQVFEAARLGCTMEEAAGILGCHSSTLSRRLQSPEFSSAWIAGQSDIRERLRDAQITAAVRDKNPTMLIWLGKQLLNQKDRPDGPTSIAIRDGDRTVTVRWDSELEDEYQDILTEEIDVTPNMPEPKVLDVGSDGSDESQTS